MQAISIRHKHQRERFIGNEPFIELAQPNLSRRLACMDVHSCKPVSIAILEIGVEIHPIASQGSQTIAVPQESREAFKLMRRVKSIQKAFVYVISTAADEVSR